MTNYLNLLFHGQRIKQGKDRIKKKNRAKGKGLKASSGGNKTIHGWTLQIQGDNGKKKNRLPNF
jgi:hypothetical protein